MNFKTEQEKFWHEQFGDDYIDRNDDELLLSRKTGQFSKMLSRTQEIDSIIEFGCNIGLNLFAIKRLIPGCEVSGIEINTKAAAALKNNYELIYDDKINIYSQSILDFGIDYQRDIVLTSGVLIHINPDFLQDVYQRLYDASKKYILIAEYYSPTPIEVIYRGNKGKLFKRDFAGEILDKFNDLVLIDYGFIYHRDGIFPGDDITWFLIKKQ